VLFNLANAPVAVPEMVGLNTRIFPIDLGTAQFDVSVNASLDPANAGVLLSYNRDLFAPETAQRLLDHFLEILTRAVEDPDRRLSEISATPRAELQTLLHEWNRTDRELPEWTDLVSAVQAVAARSPHATAVKSPTGDWTYAELVDAAASVAGALGAMGVGPGDRVAILMNRSREMLAALLGVLGAGAAYVPVDPTYPEARVRYVLEDSGAAALVTHRDLDRRFGVDVPVLDLDRWTPPPPQRFRPLRPEDPAYVIYTSGSTGHPKGVEVPHGAIRNLLSSMAAQPGLTEGDVLLAVTTLSFDIAVLELYLPLVVGGRVVIAGEDDTLDGIRLARMLDEENVTVMQATPATWKLLVAAGWTGKRDLRVLCGGEALPGSLADDLVQRVAEVWNMYGPTEATVWSTIHRVRDGQSVAIGRPIANTSTYVLTDDLEPLPIGVPGELWIGGAGVSNGYVGRSDLTAERFVESPFRQGERLYRTGDLVRYRPDGLLEHLGRLDHQVKVRGFRIELGEVEARLRSHPGVRDAVVVARDERLIAYVIYELDAPTVSALRSWVADALPAYMVPSLFHALEAFPLTPNGKVDRKALPDPAGASSDAREFRPPESEAERTIAGVWSDLLAVERIGLSDNFFELGGHSLLAMEAVSLVEQRTGHRLEPRALFFKTLGELAGSLASGSRATA
jgi:amino acid adenylation domain-containing protein